MWQRDCYEFDPTHEHKDMRLLRENEFYLGQAAELLSKIVEDESFAVSAGPEQGAAGATPASRLPRAPPRREHVLARASTKARKGDHQERLAPHRVRGLDLMLDVVTVRAHAGLPGFGTRTACAGVSQRHVVTCHCVTGYASQNLSVSASPSSYRKFLITLHASPSLEHCSKNKLGLSRLTNTSRRPHPRCIGRRSRPTCGPRLGRPRSSRGICSGR